MGKELIMLIGPKGAGKTYIGTLVDRHTDIAFLRVEPIWLSLGPGEDGWTKVEEVIDELLQSHERVMIESLGAGAGFERFHAALARKYRIRMVRVFADPDTCLARVRDRDKTDHINVSDEKVAEYNKIAAAVVHDWDLEIDNNGPAPASAILAAIRTL